MSLRAIAALKQANAISVGQIQSMFVESLTGSMASVFAVVGETVTNAANKTPQQEIIRIDMQMIDAKGGWKVNRVNILQQPGQQNPLTGG
jgi:alanine-alpha-ketoisovalerate/valine-pyruvate aminotransferase